MKDPVHLLPGIAETPSTPLRSASGIVASDAVGLGGIGLHSSCIPKLGLALFGECLTGPKVSFSPPKAAYTVSIQSEATSDAQLRFTYVNVIQCVL